MNPLEKIPLSIIPAGRRSFSIFAGPTWRLSTAYGKAVSLRDQASVVLESDRHGKLLVGPDPEDDSRLLLTLVGKGARPAALTVEGGAVILRVASGESVRLTENDGRVEVSLAGFGVIADRMRIFFSPVEETSSA
jgi:hypothetical protein